MPISLEKPVQGKAFLGPFADPGLAAVEDTDVPVLGRAAGGEAESAGEFLLEGAAAEHYPVASGTRVPAGRAVREKVYGRL